MKSQLSRGLNLPISAYFASITALPTVVGMSDCLSIKQSECSIIGQTTFRMSHCQTLRHSDTQTLGTFDCPTWDSGGEESMVLKGISIKVGGVGG